jgi:hypothetical protein
MKLKIKAQLCAVLALVLCSAANAAVYEFNFTQIDSDGLFDYMVHRDGYEFENQLWGDDAKAAPLTAEMHIKYEVDDITSATPVLTLLAADFTLAYGDGTPVPNTPVSTYQGTVDVTKTMSDHSQIYLSGNNLVVDIYDEDSRFGDGVAFSGDEVNNVKDGGGLLTDSGSGADGALGNERRFLFYSVLDTGTWQDYEYNFLKAADDGGTVTKKHKTTDADVNTLGRLYVGWEGWDDFSGNRSPLQGDWSADKQTYNTNASGWFGSATVVPEPASAAMLTLVCVSGLFIRRRFLR